MSSGEVVYDPYSCEFDAGPYPVYEQMRDEAPVYRNEALDFYALTRFDDCLAALTDWESFSSAKRRRCSRLREFRSQSDRPGCGC